MPPQAYLVLVLPDVDALTVCSLVCLLLLAALHLSRLLGLLLGKSSAHLGVFLSFTRSTKLAAQLWFVAAAASHITVQVAVCAAPAAAAARMQQLQAAQSPSASSRR